MHIKNFSLISRKGQVTLSPAYDLLNSTIALNNAKEELALPLRGRKNNLTRRDLLNYFAVQQLALNESVIDEVMHDLEAALPQWRLLLAMSFLSEPMRLKYLALLEKRWSRLTNE